MDKKVCKCGHSDSIHEYYTDTCHAKGCSCLSFQEPNSNPPSPEMVCPNCKQTIVIKKDGTISYHKVPAKDRELYGHNAKTAYCPLSGCDYQECATIPVPPPEAPERVSETKNILEQFTIQLWRTYSSQFDHHAISWEYEPDNIKEIWRREAASIYGQLQQAGWGDLKELVIENDRLEDFVVRSKDEYEKQEARIKELETELRTLKERDLARIITIDECKKRLEVLDKKLSNTELAIAQAKAEAYKEIGDAIDKTENPYKSKGVFGGEYHGTDYGVFEIARQSFKEVITKLQNGETLSK